MNTPTSSSDQLALDLFPERQRLSDPRTRDYARLYALLWHRLNALHTRARQDGAREDWQALREALAKRVVGHDALLDRLALIALMHQVGWGTQRLLLCGPPGAGKTHIARVLAEITDSPHHVQDSQTIIEAGWHGSSLAEILEGWAARTTGGVQWVETGVLVLDEIDKQRVHAQAHGNAVDKRRGVQASLLPLLGAGTPVSVGVDGRDQMRSEGLLIVLTGAFSDAGWGARAPTPEELVDYGLMQELVDRITEIIYVPVQPPELLARVYAEGPTAVLHAEERIAEHLGYRLEIDPATYRYAALRVTQRSGAVGQRAGGHWISAAARYALTRALRAGLPLGSVVRVTPDDLAVPSASDPPPHRKPDEEDDGPVPVW